MLCEHPGGGAGSGDMDTCPCTAARRWGQFELLLALPDRLLCFAATRFPLPCRHHHLQHVHPEAAPRPLGAAVCEVGWWLDGYPGGWVRHAASTASLQQCCRRLPSPTGHRQPPHCRHCTAPPVLAPLHRPPCTAPLYCTACACRYKEAFQVYIKELVLPSLRNHHDDHLLRQLKQRWDNHKVGG